MPRPPRTNDGLTRTGKPIRSAMTLASSRLVAVPFAGEIKPASSSILENAPRSSARSIASGVVPRIGIPWAASPCAKPRAVCPPS